MVDPGAVRNTFRFAPWVVQVRLAWIGTDRSLTVIGHTWAMVPAASTWPEKLVVTAEADERAAGTTRNAAAVRSAIAPVRRLRTAVPVPFMLIPPLPVHVETLDATVIRASSVCVCVLRHVGYW